MHMCDADRRSSAMATAGQLMIALLTAPSLAFDVNHAARRLEVAGDIDDPPSQPAGQLTQEDGSTPAEPAKPRKRRSWCTLGMRGGPNSTVCCWDRCTRCTSSMRNPRCALEAGGGSACCTDHIQTLDRACSTAYDTGCIIPVEQKPPRISMRELSCGQPRYGCCTPNQTEEAKRRYDPATGQARQQLDSSGAAVPWEAAMLADARVLNTSFALRAPAFTLPVDVPKLQAEMAAVLAAYPPLPQFGSRHIGNWWGTCLRSANGLLGVPGSDKEGRNYKYTRAMDLAPYTNSLLRKIVPDERNLARVRVSVLGPDSLISWHEDGFQPTSHWLETTARIHLIVSSPPGAHTVIVDKHHAWHDGELVLGHYGYPHYVYNANPTHNRTHIVIDMRIKSSSDRLALQRYFGRTLSSPGLSRRVKTQIISSLKKYLCDFPSPRAQHLAQLEAVRRAFKEQAAQNRQVGAPGVADPTVNVQFDDLTLFNSRTRDSTSSRERDDAAGISGMYPRRDSRAASSRSGRRTGSSLLQRKISSGKRASKVRVASASTP